VKASSFKAILVGLLIVTPRFVEAASSPAPQVSELATAIPTRSALAVTGSQFAERILQMDSGQREGAIRDEVLSGNIPDFLRKLVPVNLSSVLASGVSIRVTIFVTPDYLAIGSDDDYLRIPMNLYTAESIASRFGFILPTKKIVDAIYAQSSYHLSPQPMSAGPQMRSTAYYRMHNQMIQEQIDVLGIRSGALIAGHKKDVVITNRLATNEGKIAIYGWHRGVGDPIQPLSTVHGAFYADYSHGIRLVSTIVLLDGKQRSIYELLRDPTLASVLSYEGATPNPWGFTSTLLERQIFALSSLGR
jgi:hypothetical protein